MSFVVLLSGGLDSTVAATLACRDGRGLLALTADYGQRAARRECHAAAAVAARLGMPHRIIGLPFLGEISRSALVDHGPDLPDLTPEMIEAGGAPLDETARAVWVPNRNGLLVNVAAAWAEAMGAAEVVVGFNREEAATFPDNSVEYLRRASAALACSTLSGVRVVSPTGTMTKLEIVQEGYRAGAPMESIWPCYRSGEQLCWVCESCLRLDRALRLAGRLEWFRKEHSIPGLPGRVRGEAGEDAGGCGGSRQDQPEGPVDPVEPRPGGC